MGAPPRCQLCRGSGAGLALVAIGVSYWATGRGLATHNYPPPSGAALWVAGGAFAER